MTKNERTLVIFLFVFACISTFTTLLCAATKMELDQVCGQLSATQKELNVSVENALSLNRKSDQLAAELDEATKSLGKANDTILALKDTEYQLVYLGDFKITYYCSEVRKHICGIGTGTTATGTQVTPGRTIAVDPKIIPYGTQVYIEGIGWRTAEDCGGAVKGKHIDVAVKDHSTALDMGTSQEGVWILVKKYS